MLVRQPWQSWIHSKRVLGLSCQASDNLLRRYSSLPTARPSWRIPSVVSLQQCRRHNSSVSSGPPRTSSKEAEERLKELQVSKLELYPRWHSHPDAQFVSDLSTLRPSHGGSRTSQSTHEAKVADSQEVTGRIINIRRSGRRLAFLDLENVGDKLQVMLDHGAMGDLSENDFVEHLRLLRRGDHIAARGSVYTNKYGQPSVKAIELPALLAPCLHRFPVVKDKDSVPPENSELDRQEEMLTYPGLVKVIQIRSLLLDTMRQSFLSRGYIEVQTPILAGLAGGAAARPFETSATEFAHRKLSLRVAPELWLKRLVVGGLSRVFEIGPSFRNEGLDKTHNPEFTTCEFYEAHATLSTLMSNSSELLRLIQSKLLASGLLDGTQPLLPLKSESWRVIDFIPALNEHLGEDLPTLDLSNQDKILAILQRKAIPVPPTPSLPNLLDKLSSHFLEPASDNPSWIINLPECMSPLSKSFQHPDLAIPQRVAARAELFVHQKEIINCYEEENDPVTQRRKFVEQQMYAANPAGQSPNATNLPNKTNASTSQDPSNIIESSNRGGMAIDEEYLRALEWGLPPTGGWGCGIDRLVMLFAGRDRIDDVLSFGNLRAVTRNAVKVKGGREMREEETK